MKKIVEYRGIENLVYAEILEDSEEKFETGEVKSLAGVAELKKTTETASEVKYYDNVPAMVVEASGSDSVDITVSVLSLDTYGDITGQHYDETTGMLVEEERAQKNFAIGYKTSTTDGEDRLVWRLKGTFAIPDDDIKTKDKSADSNGQTLKYTGISTTHKFTKTGKSAKSIICDGAKQDEATFFDVVNTPDTVAVAEV